MYCSKANALNQLDRYEDAVKCYDQAISLNRNYSVALHHIGVGFYIFRNFFPFDNIQNIVYSAMIKSQIQILTILKHYTIKGTLYDYCMPFYSNEVRTLIFNQIRQVLGCCAMIKQQYYQIKKVR